MLKPVIPESSRYFSPYFEGYVRSWVRAQECVDHHSALLKRIVDESRSREIDDAENNVECKLRVHVEVEVVCEHTIGRGLCEDVHVGDSERADEREVDNLDELGDDERGFRKLFLWDALEVCQVPRGADVELTAVLWKGVCIPLKQRIRKARPAFSELLRPAVPLVNELVATRGRMCVSKTPEPVAEEIDVATGDVEGVGRSPEAGLLILLTGKSQQVGSARDATQFLYAGLWSTISTASANKPRTLAMSPSLRLSARATRSKLVAIFSSE